MLILVYPAAILTRTITHSSLAPGMPRGERLRSQAAGIVMNVYHYFEKMQSKSKNCATSLSALKRTSLATGISMLNIKLCYRLFLFRCFSSYCETITGQDG